MKAMLLTALLAIASLGLGVNLFASDGILVAGTLIQCTVDEPNFSTKTARVEEPLVCYAHPIRTFNCNSLLGGAELSGRLEDLKQPGRFFGKGWMQIEFDRLVVPGGIAHISTKVISIQGVKVDAEGRMLGKGHPVRDAAGWAVPVLWPIKLITLPDRGPAPALRGERTVTLRLMEDVEAPCVEPLTPGWQRFNQSSWRPSPYSTSTWYTRQ